MHSHPLENKRTLTTLRAATGDPQARNGSDDVIAASLLRIKLSDQEIDELEAFLQHRCLPKGGMNISMFDGYLTVIVSMPEFVPPSNWLPRCETGLTTATRPGNQRPDDGFVFESAQEAQRMTAFILRRMTPIFALALSISLLISDDEKMEDDSRRGQNTAGR